MRLTPDGVRYLAIAGGMRQPLPFHLRWLLPWLLGGRIWLWIAVSWGSLAASGALIAVVALQWGATEGEAVLASLLWLGLPSVRFQVEAPVLVDAAGMALVLASVALWPVSPWAAVGLAGLGGAVWEKAPVWAAVFAMEPMLLAGLLAPALRRLLVAPGAIEEKDPYRETLEHPLRTGLKAHAGQWRDPVRMALPWGVCLVVLAMPHPFWVAAVVLGYAQLVVATDTVRLYQQAAPVVAIAAASMLPIEWAVPLVLAHWLNPWAGKGI